MLTTPLRKALAALAAAAVGLPLLAWAGIALELSRLERAVVEDWRALPPRPTRRPTHVEPPLVGTVGEAFVRAVDAPHPLFPQPWRRNEPMECAQARELPAAELPEACLAVVEAQAAWARGVVASSRAEDATLTAALERLDNAHDNEALYQPSTAVQAVRVVSHDVRRAAARGEADLALDWCADALGLGRDFALRSGPSGVLFASHWAALLTGPCGEALDAASPAAKRRFAAAVDAIAAALPADGPVLREAVAWRVIELYGATFSDQTLEALPAVAVERIRQLSPNARRFVSPLTQRTALRGARALRSTLAAADSSPPERDAAIARARERLASIEREVRLDELFERFDRLRLLLRLLANAARLDAGDAEEAGAGLLLRKEGAGRVLSPAAARLARHAVRLHSDGGPPGLAP